MTHRAFKNLTAAALLAAVSILAGFTAPGAAHAAGEGFTAPSALTRAPHGAEKPARAPAARTAVLTNAYPWSAIGRFNRPGGHCTAVLVSTHAAVTAAHCLWNKHAGRMMRAHEVTFSGGWNGARHTAETKVRRIFTAPKFSGRGPAKVAAVADDWAIVILEQPLGLRFGMLEIEVLDAAALKALNARGTVFMQAGYPAEKTRVLRTQSGCKVEGWAPAADVIRHACETKSGDSGSPLFMMRNGKAGLVALHAAAGRGARRGSYFAVPAGRFAGHLKRLQLEYAGAAVSLARR
ncbi:MAG: trypsin-like serine peptidase [Rhodospirillales bacterium]